jgi:zinc transporter, ZIP family
MGLGRTLILGLVAGVTIVLGLPIGRMHRMSAAVRLVLNAVAAGVLLFLVWDVLSAAWEPIDSRLSAVHDHHAGIGPVLGYGLLFAVGLSVGLLALVWYERSMIASHTMPRSAVAPVPVGVAAGSTPQVDSSAPAGAPAADPSRWSPARRMALMIAIGIGLHNFSEGLAIGQSAASNEVQLATMLVIGFALHNATEGFGIVAPLAGDVDRHGARRIPSWPFLLGLALIGGGPTFIGTLVGHRFTSEPVSVLFLTLAAGSIIYVVTQLVGIAARARRSDLLAYGLLIGMLAGFATDAIVSAAGA